MVRNGATGPPASPRNAHWGYLRLSAGYRKLLVQVSGASVRPSCTDAPSDRHLATAAGQAGRSSCAAQAHNRLASEFPTIGAVTPARLYMLFYIDSTADEQRVVARLSAGFLGPHGLRAARQGRGRAR